MSVNNNASTKTNLHVKSTHEPEIPLPGFPHSHVKVSDVFFDDCEECVKVTIHGVSHYLHRTTALSLYNQLKDYFKGLSDQEKILMNLFGNTLSEELL